MSAALTALLWIVVGIAAGCSLVFLGAVASAARLLWTERGTAAAPEPER